MATLVGVTVSDLDEWWTCEQLLGRFLAELRDGEVLILAVTDTPRYVQFLSWGDLGVHGEVSHDRRRDPAADADWMLALGWQAPVLDRKGRSSTGTDNLGVDVPTGEAHRLAGMTVGVLRDVWAVASPQHLVGSKLNDEGGPSVAQLGIPLGAG